MEICFTNCFFHKLGERISNKVFLALIESTPRNVQGKVRKVSYMRSNQIDFLYGEKGPHIWTLSYPVLYFQNHSVLKNEAFSALKLNQMKAFLKLLQNAIHFT